MKIFMRVVFAVWLVAALYLNLPFILDVPLIIALIGISINDYIYGFLRSNTRRTEQNSQAGWEKSDLLQKSPNVDDSTSTADASEKTDKPADATPKNSSSNSGNAEDDFLEIIKD